MSYNVGRVAMSYGWTEINTEATCTTNSFTSKEKNILIYIQTFSTVRSQMWWAIRMRWRIPRSALPRTVISLPISLQVSRISKKLFKNIFKRGREGKQDLYDKLLSVCLIYDHHHEKRLKAFKEGDIFFSIAAVSSVSTRVGGGQWTQQQQ